MSKGRPRHQANRRRVYAARQRDVRERRSREVGEQPRDDREYWLSDRVVAIEIEENLDFEAPTSWAIRLPGRSAA